MLNSPKLSFKITQKLLTAFTFLFAVSGCSTSSYKPTGSDSSTLPHLSYFQEVYEEDKDNQQDQRQEDYIIWLERFYFGWILYETGWFEISNIVLHKIEDQTERDITAEKLNLVGKTVAAEWAKNSDHRAVSTRALINLGESLKESSSRGEAIKFLDHAYNDLLLLKTGELLNDDIQIERYFPDLSSDDDWNLFF